MAPNSHSITRWLENLRTGDAVAGRMVWERFLDRMLAVARRRLAGASRRVADEEDVVVVAFERFLHGVRQDRFPRLRDRDDLWAILFGFFVEPAHVLGVDPIRIGAVVSISAAGGRTLSPVAAVVLLASSMSGTTAQNGATPFEITRRIAVPILAGLTAVAVAAALLG